MSIYLGSRYETATLARITDGDGNINVVSFRGDSLFPPPSNFSHYLVVQGDRLDRISERVYGRPDLWWVIADANDGLPLADPLLPGMVLVIPSVSDIR